MHMYTYVIVYIIHSTNCIKYILLLRKKLKKISKLLCGIVNVI